MTHPCIQFANAAIATLRQSSVTGNITIGDHISPEIYFGADTEGADVSTTLHNTDTGLLNVSVEVSGDPEWLTLNIGLGSGAFQDGDTFGVVIDAQGSDSFESPAFIRSDFGTYVEDTALADPVQFGTAHGLHTLLHPFGSADPIVYGSGYHTLVLPLPHRSLSLHLRDLRLFTTPTRGQAATLGGFAA